MTTTWRARPTTYKGIQMRSRLEARWAATLDGIGAEWEYEPRAFANAHGQYLPDFYLPAGGHRGENIYIEIRPTLERAYLAMPHMQIIWDSDPTAVLEVVADSEDLMFIAGLFGDRTWRNAYWLS